MNFQIILMPTVASFPGPNFFGQGLGTRLCLLHAVHSGISSDEKGACFRQNRF